MNDGYDRESELEIARYIFAVIRARRLIAAWSAAGLFLGALAAWLSPDSYQATALVDVRQAVDAGGVNPGSFRYREALAVIETGFVLGSTGDNQLQVTTAELSSRDLATAFIEGEGVLPELFPRRWDAEENHWNLNEVPPSKNEAVRILLEDHLTIELDLETSIISVSMKARTPDLAADWVNGLVALFNDRKRAKAIERSDRRIAALLERLAETQIVELERAIYRIIEAETQVGLLARADNEYAVEVIDAAVPPEGPVGASVRRYSIIGSSLGFLGSISFALARLVFAQLFVWLQNARLQLA